MDLRPGIFSLSLGHANVHHLPHKLKLAQQHGFQGVELSYNDLAAYSNDDRFEDDVFTVARHISEMCDEFNLDIICLRSFEHYEALVDCNEKYADLNRKLLIWLRVSFILFAETILVPSNFLPDTGGKKTVMSSREVGVSDLKILAEKGEQAWNELKQEAAQSPVMGRKRLPPTMLKFALMKQPLGAHTSMHGKTP